MVEMGSTSLIKVSPQSLLGEIGGLKHFLRYQRFSDVVIDPPFSLSPFERLRLISFCELGTPGLRTHWYRLAALTPDAVVTESAGVVIVIVTVPMVTEGQCPVSSSEGRRLLEGNGPEDAPSLQLFPSPKERGTEGALQHRGGVVASPSYSGHTEFPKRPGALCLLVAHAAASSSLRFESSRLFSS